MNSTTISAFLPAPSRSNGLYCKPVMIVNDDSRVINTLETSLTDEARVVIFNCRMFIVKDTDLRQNLKMQMAVDKAGCHVD